MFETLIAVACTAAGVLAAAVAPKIVALYKSWAEGRALTDFTNLYNNFKASWAKRPKLSGWMFLGLLGTAALLYTAPAIVTAVMYKFVLTNVAIIWLYVLATHIWPHSRPSSYLDENENVKPNMELPYAASLLTQAVFVVGGLIGFALLV